MNQQQVVDERRGHTSASNAQADANCPGRHLAQAGLPDIKGEYADTGDRIHYALGHSGDSAFLTQLTLAERETFDLCREIEAKKAGEYLDGANQTNQGGYRVFREERLWAHIEHQGKVIEHSAKPDAVYRAGTMAMVVEYKTLYGDVPDAPNNLQLRDQAVMAWRRYSPVTEVGVVVVQPGVKDDPKICVYNQAELLQAENEMWTRVIASNTPGQPRIPGELQCKFCKAATRCVERQKWLSNITPPAMLQVMEVPMENWSPEQRAHAASMLAPAQKFLDDLKAFLKDGIAKDGASFCPGWELGKPQRRETIDKPEEAFKRFGALGGKLETFLLCISVKKTLLKEAVATTTGKRGKALDTAMKELTQDIVSVTMTEPSLKRLEDK